MIGCNHSRLTIRGRLKIGVSMYGASITKRSWYRTIFGALLLVVLAAGILVHRCVAKAVSEDQSASEYEVKAAYIYYFAKFTEWPADVLPAKFPITIGVIGDNEFASLLSNIVKNKKVQEHLITVRILKWSADLRACHMVYVSSSERKRFVQIARSLQQYPILTVTEAEDGSQAKGIMNLFFEGGRVQFEADIPGAERAHLQISSKLLRLARGSTGIREAKGK